MIYDEAIQLSLTTNGCYLDQFTSAETRYRLAQQQQYCRVDLSTDVSRALSDTDGSIVTLICDSASRYQETYFNPTWLAAQDYDLTAARARIGAFWTGRESEER